MTISLPRLRAVRRSDVRATIDRVRQGIERHRDTVKLAAGLVLGGAFLCLLLLGCSFLLLEVIASAVAPAARELGIGAAG
jgi:hypothetical protein